MSAPEPQRTLGDLLAMIASAEEELDREDEIMSAVRAVARGS